MDSISKLIENTTKPKVKTTSNKTTKYFLSGPAYESDKKKVLNLHSKYIKTLMYLMALGALKAHFPCS